MREDTALPRLAHLAVATVFIAATAFGQGGGGGVAATRVGPKMVGKAANGKLLPKLPGKAAPATAVDKLARRTAELDRFDRMSPEQRRKALDRLPPERKQRIEQGLEQYRAMNPENRERLRNFERMSAEKRDAVRQSFVKMQELPQPRRAMVRREVQQLRGLTDAERDTRMQSEAFRRRFDANEQGLIHEMVSNLPLSLSPSKPE